jgi:hypothetical protein
MLGFQLFIKRFSALYKKGDHLSSPPVVNIDLQNILLQPPLKSFEKILLYLAKAQDL